MSDLFFKCRMLSSPPPTAYGRCRRAHCCKAHSTASSGGLTADEVHFSSCGIWFGSVCVFNGKRGEVSRQDSTPPSVFATMHGLAESSRIEGKKKRGLTAASHNGVALNGFEFRDQPKLKRRLQRYFELQCLLDADPQHLQPRPLFFAVAPMNESHVKRRKLDSSGGSVRSRRCYPWSTPGTTLTSGECTGWHWFG